MASGLARLRNRGLARPTRKGSFMLSINGLRSLINKAIIVIYTSGFLAIAGAPVANALTAGDVLNKMNTDQRYGYIAGVVEGLAYSRWLKDKPQNEGMKCIYDWYYGKPGKNWERINSWLTRHPDKPVGALLYVLIKKECGA